MDKDTNFPRRETLFSLDRKDTAFAICAVAECIFTSALGLFEGFNLGFCLSAVVMLVLFTLYFSGKNRVGAYPAVCGGLALLLSAVFVCTSNGSVRFFSIIMILLLALIFFSGLLRGDTRGNQSTLGVFSTALATIERIPMAIKSLFSNENGNKKTVGKVLVGVLCAVPVLAVVIPLLLSSDDAFHGMMTDLFSNTKTAIAKTVIGLLLSPAVVAYGFSSKKGVTTEKVARERKGVENAYLISFLAVISLCYVLYLFSQLAYFFSAIQGFLPEGGMTYAHYARKGFFEMCVIAVINLVLVFVSLMIAKKEKGSVCIAVKGLTTFIAVFTLIIVATAVSKMVLYIGTYGMTVLRVTTSAFMLFVTVVFISVILRIYMHRINIIKVALVTAGSILLILGLTNVNALCARYNYESYLSGRLQTVDVEELYRLGDEGVPYLVELASGPESPVATKAQKYLAMTYIYRHLDAVDFYEDFTLADLEEAHRQEGFARFSIPRARAYKSLHRYLQTNPQFGSSYQNAVAKAAYLE